MDVLEFTLKNGISRFSAYNNYYCHDTSRSHESIFMKFTWLVRVHTWVKPIFYLFFFFERIGPIQPLMGKICPENGFLAFIQPLWGFLKKKFQIHIWYPIFHRKGYIHFCCLTPCSLKNSHASQQIFFTVILENIVFLFFWKNCHIKNIQSLISYKKAYIDFCHQISSFSKNGHLSLIGLSQFFQHKLKNIREVFLLEGKLIRKKILWRINFVFIKFSPNALLFEKLQHECKNPSFLYKVTCIKLDHTGTVAKFHIHDFILKEALPIFISHSH